MRKSIRELRLQHYHIIIMCLILAVAVTFSSFIVVAKGTQHNNESYKYYTSIQIECGDTLWKLAKDYITIEYNSVDEYISEIVQLNNLKDEHIHEGQFLMMPYYSQTERNN